MKLGELIREQRTNKGWTIKELIENLGITLTHTGVSHTGVSHTSVSVSYISEIELGREIPSPELLKRITDALGLEYDEMSMYAQREKLKQFKKILKIKYKGK